MNFYQSVIESIAHHAMKHPNKTALADSKKAVTYKELWTAVFCLSKKLEALGVSPGKCVVVECSQDVNYMICEFAVHMLGGIFVPLEKNAAISRTFEIFADTEAVLYIGKKEIPELMKNNISFYPVIRAMTPAETASSELKEAAVHLGAISFPASDDISEILFSTGTTGKSKGIVLTHGNDMAIAENVICGVKMKPENVELVPMPLSHSHGLRRTYANLVNGSCTVFSDGVTLLKKVFDLIEKYNVTSMDLSPSMLSIIFKLSRDRLGDYADTMDYIQLGSAPLSEEDKLHLSRILPDTRLYNFYGSTEAGCSCLLDFNSMSGKPGCIGRPAVNAHFIVVDEDRNEIESSIDNTGFLASSGSINMKCYFKAPELTEAAMSKGYIYTKDLGYIDEDGLVYMLGRKDDVINYGGIKISPEEIESMVMHHDNIEDCACIPVKDAITGQAPKLYIVWNPAGKNGSCEYDYKTFKEYLACTLDASKQPKYIELIDEIPRTFNGKIKRNLLMEKN